MPTVLRALLLAVVFTALPVAIGVAMTGTPHQARRAPTYTSTALQDYDTTSVVIDRGAFCDRIPADAVSAALGAPAREADAYADGDRRPLTPAGPGVLRAKHKATGDVLHEFGCTFIAGTARARAWVFAPPVTGTEAKALAKVAKGCASVPAAPAFGSPSSASVCGKATRTATYRGLFGDAWLSCSLSVPGKGTDRATLLDRAGKWCVAVAKAASAD